MAKRINTTAVLTKAAVKMFVRNRQALFFTLIMPIIIMTLLGLIGFDKVPTIDVGLAVHTPNAATQAFIDQLKKIEILKITQGTEISERAALETGNRALVVVIPDALLPEGTSTPAFPQHVLFVRNAGEASAQTAISILQQVFDQATLAMAHTPQVFDIRTEEINTYHLKYIDFLLPGIIAMSIMQMAVFSVAFVFVDYKEKGILKRIVATPVRPYQFVIANIVTRLIVALLQAAILLGIGVLFFSAHVVGSYWLMFLIALLGSIMFLGLGFTISGVASTVESVPAIANLTVFPMLFLAGVFFSTDAMPVWLQHVSNYLPLTHFAHAMREVMTKGATFTGIGFDLLWMAGWGALLIFLSTMTFKFEEKRV